MYIVNEFDEFVLGVLEYKKITLSLHEFKLQGILDNKMYVTSIEAQFRIAPCRGLKGFGVGVMRDKVNVLTLHSIPFITESNIC